MIPAVLPSNRVDARAEARPPGDDRGFDDALRRAADDGPTARECAGMRPADDLDDRGAAADPVPAEEERPRPEADEPAAPASADDPGVAAVVAGPAPTGPAPADVAAEHPPAAGEPAAGAASPGTRPAGLDAPAEGGSAADELVVATAADAEDPAHVAGPAGATGGAAGSDVAPDAPDAASGPAEGAALEAVAAGSGRQTGGSSADDAHEAASADGADRPTAPMPGPPARDVDDAYRASPTTGDPASATADDVAPPPAAAPTAPTGGATAPAPATAAPPLARQLVQHVTPLVEGPDGTHELTIELRPATLGRVQLEVTLEDGVLHVRVHAEDPASRRLLGQSLGELRVALADAGISAGNLDVGDPGTGGGARTTDRDADGHPGARAHDPATAPARPAAAGPVRSLPDGRTALDVLL